MEQKLRLRAGQIRLIALDLDGTLLDTEKVLRPENEAALRRAAESGIEIVPATGRFYTAIDEAVRKLPYIHYVITVNGAKILAPGEDRVLFRAEIDWRRAVEVMRVLDRLPVIYDCFMDDWGWMTRSLYDQAADYAPNQHCLEMLRTKRSPVPELKAHLAAVGHGVQKIQMFFRDPELRMKTLADLKMQFPDLAVTSSIPRNLELNNLEAQKGTALRRLAAHIGIAPEQTMAFGDDWNDLSMLRAAGIAVAMGNAAPELQAEADFVTLSCDENGVAKALEQLLPI